MGVRPALLLTALATAIGGCALLVSTDGLVGGGATAPDASGVDAPADVQSSADASVVSDAAVDQTVIDSPFDAPPDAVEDAGVLGTTEVRLAYATAGGLALRTFDTVSSTWSAASAGPAFTGMVPRFVVPRASPTGAELLGVLGNDGSSSRLEIFGRGVTAFTSLFSSTAITSANAVRRGFDVAFEALSGHGLVVYVGTGGALKYRTVSGGVASAEANVFNVALSADPALWVELVSRPQTDEISLLFTDAGRRLMAAKWTGNAWDAGEVLDTHVNRIDFKAFAGAYEQNSGTFVVAWGYDGAGDGSVADVWMGWRRRPAGQAFTATALIASGKPPGALTLAPRAGSNDIAIAYDEWYPTCNGGSCDDFMVGLWNNGSWSVTSLDSDMTTSYGSRSGSSPAGVAWIPGASVAVAMYHRDSPSFRWSRYSGSWGALGDAPVANIAAKVSFQSAPLPGGSVLTVVSDVNGALWAKKYNGTTWADTEAQGAPLTGALTSVTGVPFGLAAR